MTLFEMLRHDEGCKLTLYKDTEGYWTIGIGHLVSKNSKQEAISILGKETITLKEAELIFSNDINTTINDIKKSPRLNKLYNSLSVNRQNALINMCFQLGVAGVLGFNNSLTMLEQMKWNEASVNLRLSKWHRQTTNRAERVISVFETDTMNAY
ncbi:glycoside hydrolase family protein [Serratia marcescens]|uniref:glycoside hydrolase family protein n=1 Tax=Serratia marcescens TaxID=615 RepID=UPI000664E059|nr:glycoside hydrolase family protein [Serratia marcescens]BEN87053.1 hypothetical protein SMQC07_08520 [Serratia marcescens]BEN92240.1 hypothetical protein SMQC08_08530 [Serratia marcescens]BEN97566.1 hypothetical protein SMQC11_08550 [Serratia marcescens]